MCTACGTSNSPFTFLSFIPTYIYLSIYSLIELTPAYLGLPCFFLLLTSFPFPYIQLRHHHFNPYLFSQSPLEPTVPPPFPLPAIPSNHFTSLSALDSLILSNLLPRQPMELRYLHPAPLPTYLLRIHPSPPILPPSSLPSFLPPALISTIQPSYH